VFVTGGTRGSSGSYATVAYDATTGAQLWAARYTGPAKGDNTASSLAVSPSGGTVFVTGSSLRAVVGNIAYSDYATVAYNATTGAKLWAARYSGLAKSTSAATSVAVSPSGGTVFVTGYSVRNSSSKFHYATVAYNAATGAQIWAARYTGPDKSNNTAFSLAVSPSGGVVFVTGSSQVSSSGSYATIAYNAATGAQIWAARYNGPEASGATSVAVSPSGATVFVTGQTYVGSNKSTYATVAYNATTGTELWAARYNGPAHADNSANALAISLSGKTVYVTGASEGVTSGYDYATVAYNAVTGAQLWAARYNGSATGDDDAFSVAVSPTTGAVFVTGESYPPYSPNPHFVTVAYHG
jgi:outer membrane protein assembly factor BamB